MYELVPHASLMALGLRRMRGINMYNIQRVYGACCYSQCVIFYRFTVMKRLEWNVVVTDMTPRMQRYVSLIVILRTGVLPWLVGWVPVEAQGNIR